MNDALKMQISAFVDGELPENESELLLRRLGQDAVLRQQVSHYLQIGRMVRREPEIRGMDSLRGRIAASLGEAADEPVASVPESRSRYTRLMAGTAIAASVALLGLFSLQKVDLQGAADVDGLDTGVAEEVAEASFSTVPELEDMTDYSLLDEMRRHHADSPQGGTGDILSRVVRFEIQGRELVEIDPVSRSLGPDEEPQDESASDPSEDANEPRQAE